jgi:hypothetical protein
MVDSIDADGSGVSAGQRMTTGGVGRRNRAMDFSIMDFAFAVRGCRGLTSLDDPGRFSFVAARDGRDEARRCDVPPGLR